MRSNRIFNFMQGTSLALALMVPVCANAQADVTTADANNADIPGEIVVTAQKRPELLSRAALSVSAVGGDDLRSQGVNNASRLQDAVPALLIDKSNGLRVTIRGVSSADGTEKGDPSAAMLLNGVYLARQQSLTGAFYDLDHIEVLRGPQGTLYGRNATAGVINVITKKPADKFEAAANLELGNYGTYRGDVMVNLPVNDRIAVRAAASYNKHDSYLVRGEGIEGKLGNDQDEYSVRLSARALLGSEDQGSLEVIADYGHQGGIGPQSVKLANFYSSPFSDPQYITSGSKAKRTVNYQQVSNGHLDDKNYGITGQFDWDFGGIGLTYLGSYRVFDRDELFTLPFESSGVYPDDNLSGKTFSNSQELRLSTTGDGPLKAVAGLYYFREKTTDLKTLLPNLFGFSLYGFVQDPTIGMSKAAFGQATYSLTDFFRLTGGVRYSRDTKSRAGITIIQSESTQLDPSEYTIIGVNDAKKTFSKVTWKGGFEADAGRNVLVYGTVATGYKAGGFNDGCSSSSSACIDPVSAAQLYYKPEMLTSYEAGIKAHTADHALTLNVSAFHYDYTNLQLSTQLTTSQVTANAGKAKVDGAEIEMVARPARNDEFTASMSLLDARYASYSPLSGVDWHNKRLDNSPTSVIMMGYSHTVPLASGAQIVAHADSRWSAAYYLSDFTRAIQYRQPSYTTTNATITYNAPQDAWYVQAFVNNIENTIRLQGTPGRAFVSDPRLYGVRAGVKF
ncbi:TonB-dependent receptor [Novosphingobium resinovorum]|uniref:TonB-dependent receptor n=1 Tax=Novosphingobium resinovorum TaxID=158500 RepID=UPI002ED35CC8